MAVHYTQGAGLSMRGTIFRPITALIALIVPLLALMSRHTRRNCRMPEGRSFGEPGTRDPGIRNRP